MVTLGRKATELFNRASRVAGTLGGDPVDVSAWPVVAGSLLTPLGLMMWRGANQRPSVTELVLLERDRYRWRFVFFVITGGNADKACYLVSGEKPPATIKSASR